MKTEEILEIIKNEFGMSIPKDMSGEATSNWIAILKNFGIDIENKEQCQALLDKYNKEKNKNIDVAKVMKMPIEELKLSTRTYNCLKKAFFNKVLDIISHNQLMGVRSFGEKKYTELRQKLLEYGIDIDDKLQCQALIEEYDKQKSTCTANEIEVLEIDKMDTVKSIEENKSIEKILNLTVEDFNFDAKMFNVLKRAGINTAYDLVKKEDLRQVRNLGAKRFEELKQKFIEYGIDLENRVQCDELIEKYDALNPKKDKEDWEKQLELQESNDALEDELELKQDTLLGLKQQLERREYLNKKVAECDKEFERLMKLYKTLNSKESSNEHGTK